MRTRNKVVLSALALLALGACANDHPMTASNAGPGLGWPTAWNNPDKSQVQANGDAAECQTTALNLAQMENPGSDLAKQRYQAEYDRCLSMRGYEALQ